MKCNVITSMIIFVVTLYLKNYLHTHFNNNVKKMKN